MKSWGSLLIFWGITFSFSVVAQEIHQLPTPNDSNVRFSFDVRSRSVFVEIEKDGQKQSLVTLVGIGPEFVSEDDSAPTSVVPVEIRTNDDGTLFCRYEVAHGDQKDEFSLELSIPDSLSASSTSESSKLSKPSQGETESPSGKPSESTRPPFVGEIQIRVRSDSTNIVAVRSGTTLSDEKWFRFCSRRYAEAYGQPFWPRTVYFPERSLFLDASWSIADGWGTRWDENDDNRFSGDDAFATCPAVLYEPAFDGKRSPVSETLTLRIGDDLWQTVPRPRQKPSEYLDEMRNMIYLDLWSGTAREAKSFLEKLSVLTQGKIRFLTVFQNWEAGGWDFYLPDSVSMPDYPPNPRIGTIDELAELTRFARTQGRFALRTNYLFLQRRSPSFRSGKARFALDRDGDVKWHIRLEDVDPILERQEKEIADLFRPNANFSDQLTSGAAPWAYLDYNPEQSVPLRMNSVLEKQREIVQNLKKSQNGPFGSESLMDEHLLGEFVDFGDFGIYDGRRRSLTPEFKLRRLHRLTVFYGTGLMYRFFENPPFNDFHSGKREYITNEAYRDDYRAVEVLFGNGAYFFYLGYENEKNIPWDFILTEALLVGTLQRRYLAEEVESVSYWQGGRWQTLPDLLEQGIDPTVPSWLPQSDALKRIQVVYKNGLKLIVNRLDEEFVVSVSPDEPSIILPKSGWVAWTDDGSLRAYSARPENHDSRIDFIDDRKAGIRYFDPRRSRFLDREKPSLWIDGVEKTLDF